MLFIGIFDIMRLLESQRRHESVYYRKTMLQPVAAPPPTVGMTLSEHARKSNPANLARIAWSMLAKGRAYDAALTGKAA